MDILFLELVRHFSLVLRHADRDNCKRHYDFRDSSDILYRGDAVLIRIYCGPNGRNPMVWQARIFISYNFFIYD